MTEEIFRNYLEIKSKKCIFEYMQLSKFISELLLEHDCVTVPGLGSFLGNFKSAHYDLENATQKSFVGSSLRFH